MREGCMDGSTWPDHDVTLTQEECARVAAKLREMEKVHQPPRGCTWYPRRGGRKVTAEMVRRWNEDWQKRMMDAVSASR